MNNSEEISLPELFSSVVEDEKPNSFNISGSLEIAEYMNQSKANCIEGVELLRKHLDSFSTIHVFKSLLENLVKNCTMRFHYQISSAEFMATLKKILRNKRKKGLSFLDRIFKDQAILEKIEHKVLYLIQLWADTFMMHEEEFKHILELYRQLRKEKIPFPERDKNEIFMIKFDGTKSPIFDCLERNEIVKGQDDQVLQFKNNEIEFKGNDEEAKDPNDDEEEDEDYQNAGIDPDEIALTKGSLEVLKEIVANSKSVGEIKNEMTAEIIENLKEIRQRIKMIRAYAGFKSLEDQLVSLSLYKGL